MKTIDLRNRTQNAPLLIFLGVLVLLFVVNALAPAPAQTQAQPTPALSRFIMVLTTPVPTVEPTPDTAMRDTIARLERRVAELEAQRAAPEPQAVYQQMAVQAAPEPTPAGPGYTAHTNQGDVFVPDNATVVPAGQPYTGPFLAPVLPTPSGARVCKTFGGDPNDWRAFDLAYQTSPACRKAP